MSRSAAAELWLCRSDLCDVVLVRAALADGGYDNFLEQQWQRRGGGGEGGDRVE